MSQTDLKQEDLYTCVNSTPAFVCNEQKLETNLKHLSLIADAGCQLFYPLKTNSYLPLLDKLAPVVHGFSVSSLFEARLANKVLLPGQKIHITTPGFRPNEITELVQLCDFFALNSLAQFDRFGPQIQQGAELGLRINPGLSFADDDRYNPCRQHSKLGVPLADFKQWLQNSVNIRNLSGLHFHSIFGAESYQPLVETVQWLEKHFNGLFTSINWLSLGGGYLIDRISDLKPLVDLINYLKDRYQLSVHFEPGKGVVDQCFALHASVIDLFNSDGKQIAVLDTCVNHLPEVFEYQRQPRLLQHDPQGKYQALLVGCSCMAGDVFGDYCFEKPLTLGQQLSFPDVGAYTLVKSHRFNGINLPDIYWLKSDGKLTLQKIQSYQSFLQSWTADA